MSLSLFSHSQHDRPHSSVLKRINDINANEIVWHQRFLKFNVINSALKMCKYASNILNVICDLKLLSRNRFALKPTRPINKVHARTKNETNVQYRIFSSVHTCSVQACSQFKSMPVFEMSYYENSLLPFMKDYLMDKNFIVPNGCCESHRLINFGDLTCKMAVECEECPFGCRCQHDTLQL